MIEIKKIVFGSAMTIPQMVELIAASGIQAEHHRLTSVKDELISLTEIQLKWIEEFVSESKIVHLSAGANQSGRQTGRTSMGIGMVLTTALFQDRSNSIILASTDQMSQYHRNKTLDYLRIFCEAFNLSDLITRTTRDRIELVNGSVIRFSKTKDHVLRGISCDNVFLDLFNTRTVESIDEELMYSLIPMISTRSSSKLIVSLGE